MSLLETAQILGNLGAFVGAVAIVVTLAFLAVQVRQNTESVRATAYQEWVATNMQLNMIAAEPTMSPLFAAGNFDSRKLSSDTFVAFAMWNLGAMQMAQATDYLYRSGSLDRELWESEMTRAAGILSMPGVRQWWDAGGRTQVTPRFAELVESHRPKDMRYWNWDSERGFVGGEVYAPPSDV